MANFTGTIQNLENLDGKEVSIADLFDLLRMVIQEAKGDKKLSSLPSGDERKLILQMQYILQSTNFIIGKYSPRFDEILGESSENLESLMQKCIESESNLSQMRNVLESEESKRIALVEANRKAQEASNQLRLVREECESLRGKIATLDTASLVEISRERDELRKSFDSKKTSFIQTLEDINNVLSDETIKISDEIEEQGLRYRQLSSKLTDINSQRNDLTSKIETAESERQALIDVLGELESNEAWLSEQSSLFASSYSALNSFLNEDFLEQNIFQDSATGERLSVADIPELPDVGRKITSTRELRTWIKDMQKRISKMLDVYRTELKELITVSESLTATNVNK